MKDSFFLMTRILCISICTTMKNFSNPMQAKRGGHRDSNFRGGEGTFSFRGRALQESPFSWYKVTVSNFINLLYGKLIVYGILNLCDCVLYIAVV